MRTASRFLEASHRKPAASGRNRHGTAVLRESLSRFLGAPLTVRARRAQCEHTGSERIVPPAASGGSGRPAAPGRTEPPTEKARWAVQDSNLRPWD